MTQVDEGRTARLDELVIDGEIRPPDVGDYIRDLREFLRLGREDVRDLTKISVSYLADVERNEKRPSDQVLESLAAAFSKAAAELRADNPSGTYVPAMGEAEKRHMFELRNQSTTFPDVELLRSQITPALLEWLDEPYLVAVFDRQWNYLVGNEHYQRAFPGLAESGNLMRWYFDLGPAKALGSSMYEPAPWFRFPGQAEASAPVSAKSVVCEWEVEARANTAWFKGLIGKCRTSPWALNLLGELGTNADFRRFWREERLVRFGRNPKRPYLYLRDPQTGEQSAINVLASFYGSYLCTHIGLQRLQWSETSSPTTLDRTGRPSS